MIPLKDTTKPLTFPYINYMLLSINIIVFLYELSLGNELNNFFYEYGLIPKKLISFSSYGFFERFVPFGTSLFIHGGILHLLGNLLFLFIFGANVEDRLGHFKYLLFYLICGFGAALFQILTNFRSEIPVIGASGAISGVLGAYLVYFPHSRILTLVPIFIFIHIMHIRAYIFILIWFIFQFVSGIGASSAGSPGGIAFWAHIGGFICGTIFAHNYNKKYLRKRVFH
ncbi:MAG: rhomboid family intramembrane serine protease [Candidatus Dadabacteria bacterium]|nr:rhomboid family intramembrane serine protease [Candidatus Dadabacteria bacterium]NIQ15795.1 rhomboid family intramembrane serine protease [Candidatus Dadabacteria bacterium]